MGGKSTGIGLDTSQWIGETEIMKTLYYSKDITGDQYRSFIHSMAQMFPICSLACQNLLMLRSRCLSALDRLRPFLISEEDVDEYPGSFGYPPGAVKCLKYQTTPECVRVLCDTCSSLFEWENTDLPEDLAFYREDGTNSFGSVSHEGYCFFVFSPSELEKLRDNFPEIHANLESE